MTRDPRKLSELSLHKAVVQHLKLKALPDVVWFHVPNGESRSPRTAAKLKAMGVRAGVPDLLIIVPGRKSVDPPNIRFLEFKALKGKVSEAQSQFLDDLDRLGCDYAVVRSIDQAICQLEDWGVIV